MKTLDIFAFIWSHPTQCWLLRAAGVACFEPVLCNCLCYFHSFPQQHSKLMCEEAMASKEPASFVDRTTWDFLNLLDMLGSRNGRVGVMEVDHADSRAPSLLVDFTRDLCGTGDIKHRPQQADDEGKEEEDLVPPHLIFMLWQASVLKRLMQWDHLEEAVRDVRNLLPCLPDVLVLVMIRPDSQEQLDQAVSALRRMQCVLDGALQLPVETAIYSPGQPGGVLEAKKAACRALREALNCHEEVDSQEPFVISLPELRYCRVLPECRQEKVSKTDGE